VRLVNLADVVDGADVGMPQRGRGLRLPVEPLEQLARRIVPEVGRLERDLPAELHVLGEVDGPHRPAAERPHDAVTAELAGQNAAAQSSEDLGPRLGRHGLLRPLGIAGEPPKVVFRGE
jgi:hypothetical protein